MNTEPPPIPDPHSTHSLQATDTRPKEPRSPFKALLWGVMIFVCLGMDAFLLLMLSWLLADAFKGHTSSSFLPLSLLIALALLLTWFSFRQWRQCVRSD